MLRPVNNKMYRWTMHGKIVLKIELLNELFMSRTVATD